MRVVYYVVRSNGNWKIEAGSMNLGPYPSRAEAVRTAIDAAAGTSRSGQQAQVIAQGECADAWDTLYPHPPPV